MHDRIAKKEECLRECFTEVLLALDTEKAVPVHEAKKVLMLGGLWHHAHELLKAQEHSEKEMTAETMELKATGLRSIK